MKRVSFRSCSSSTGSSSSTAESGLRREAGTSVSSGSSVTIPTSRRPAKETATRMPTRGSGSVPGGTK